MSIPRNSFNIYRAIVHSTVPATGAVRVLIPSFFGETQTVSVNKEGLVENAGVYNVPPTGSTVFVYANDDLSQVYWPKGGDSGAAGDVAQDLADHISAPDPHPQYQTQTEGDARYLRLTGGALTGATTLSVAPVNPTDLVRKFDLDAVASGTHDHDSLYVNTIGDTMTGTLNMNNNKITGLAAATSNGDAVRYEQLTAAVGSYLPLAGGTLTGPAYGTLFEAVGSGEVIRAKQSGGGTAAYVSTIGSGDLGFIAQGDGTGRRFALLSDDASNSGYSMGLWHYDAGTTNAREVIHTERTRADINVRTTITSDDAGFTALTVKGAVSQGEDLQRWVNSSSTVLAGVDEFGNVFSSLAPTAANHLTRKDYVDGVAGDLAGHIAAPDPHPQYLTAAEGDAAYVNIGGDTLTGHLLGITPTLAAHLTRKDYVDQRVLRAGDTMTGTLVLASPAGLSHAPSLTNLKYQAQGGLRALEFPLSGILWHDLFRFQRFTPVFEKRISSVWTSSTTSPIPFAGRADNNVAVVTAASSEDACRWVWTNTSFSYIEWIFISFNWGSPTPVKDILVEWSTDGVNYTTAHTTTNISDNTYPTLVHLGRPVQSETHLRLTLTLVSGTEIRVASIQGLTARWSDQGRGPEADFPFSWGPSKSIVFQTNDTTTPTFAVQQNSGQSARLMEWRSSGGTPLSWVETSGNSSFPVVSLSATAPTAVSHATRKDYVDTADGLRVLKAGDTMTGTLSLPSLTGTSSGTLNVTNNLSVTGNLTVNGTTTTVNSTTVTIDDPIFTLGGDVDPVVDDNKDRGIEFRWHNGATAKVGFFGFDDSTGKFTFIPDALNTSEVFSGTPGEIVASLDFSNVLNWTSTLDTRYINTSGDTLTGHLLGITPTLDAHLTRKDYVDGVGASAASALATHVTATGAHTATRISFDGTLLSPISKLWHPDTIVNVQNSLTTIIAEIDGRIEAGDTQRIIDALNAWTAGDPQLSNSSVFQAGVVITDALAAGAVVASKIAANTITASQIAAGTITGAELSATTSITIGTGTDKVSIVGTALDTTTVIRSGGATGYNVGTGFWLDASGRMFIGTAAGNKMTYTGGVLTVTGTVNASAGTIGGWTLGATTITGTNMVLTNTGNLAAGSANDIVRLSADDATYRLWAGHATAASAPFNVTKAGVLSATGATISGTLTSTSGTIGGWTLGPTTLTGTNMVLTNTGNLAAGTANNIVRISADDATYRLWAGHATAASAPFRVTAGGALTATSGAIGGINLAATKLYVGTGNFNNTDTAFYVDNAGQFSLKNQLSWNGTTLSVQGSAIVSGTITVAALGVSDRGANLVTNASFEDADLLGSWGYVEGGTGGLSVSTTDAPPSGLTCMKITGGGVNKAYGSRRIPVAGGKTYKVSAWLKHSNGNGTHYLRMNWADGAFNPTNQFITSATRTGITDLRSNLPNTGITSWTESEHVWTAPANARWVSVCFYNWSLSTGDLLVDNVVLEEQLPGVFIKDGAITADKIAANTITASQIAADTITGSQIAASAISASEIAAGTITGDKLNATTSITIGTHATAKWVIDGTSSATTSAIHTANATAYGDVDGVWLGADGRVSLKDKLTFDGTTLTITGGGTFSGALSAATGTFAGSLTAATGTFAGELTAATGSFSGTVTAAAGAIGGWAINPGNLASDNGITLDSDNDRITAGTGTYVARLQGGAGTAPHLAIFAPLSAVGGVPNYAEAATPFFAGANGNVSIGQRLYYSSGTQVLTVEGIINATAGNITNNILVGTGANKIRIRGGTTTADTNISSGDNTYNTPGTGFYLGADGYFSLGQKLTWNGTNLDLTGDVSATSFSLVSDNQVVAQLYSSDSSYERLRFNVADSGSFSGKYWDIGWSAGDVLSRYENLDTDYATYADMDTAVGTYANQTALLSANPLTASLFIKPNLADDPLNPSAVGMGLAMTYNINNVDYVVDLTGVEQSGAPGPTKFYMEQAAGVGTAGLDVDGVNVFEATDTSVHFNMHVTGVGGYTFVQDTQPTAKGVGNTWYNTATGDAYIWYDSYWVQTSPGGGGGGGGSDGFSFAQDATPTATANNQTWYDTNSGASYIWYNDGNTSQWVQFAGGRVGSVPGGVVGYAERITTTAAISTTVDITGLTVTFTAVAGRLYKATVHIPEAVQATTTGQQQIFLRDGANTILNRSVIDAQGSTATMHHHLTWVGTLAAGTQTLKVSASSSAGTFSLTGAATVRNTLIVEDIGMA